MRDDYRVFGEQMNRKEVGDKRKQIRHVVLSNLLESGQNLKRFSLGIFKKNACHYILTEK